MVGDLCVRIFYGLQPMVYYANAVEEDGEMESWDEMKREEGGITIKYIYEETERM